MSEFEKKELEEAKLERQTKDSFLKKLLGIILILPYTVIGFSEMYYPKYAADDSFKTNIMIAGLVGLAYFFGAEVRLILSYLDKKNR